jgi:hypothetical protein
LSLGLPLPSPVLEGADEFLLLGVDGDRGLTAALKLPDSARDVLELRVAVRMVASR